MKKSPQGCKTRDMSKNPEHTAGRMPGRDDSAASAGQGMRDEQPPQTGAPGDGARPDDARPGDSEAPGRFGAPGAQLQLRPLSIQAAALVKCIDGLSNIFWISFAGTFVSIFFASLNQLDANAASDHVFLGEYQVPKSILPIGAVAFSLFVFWLTANRLKVLDHALHTTLLPAETVHEIFRLNPPVLHVFQVDNLARWSPASGVNVFLINWAVFFGNSMALTWSSVLQQGAYFGQFSPTMLAIYLLLIVAVIVYGSRAIVPAMRSILGTLHEVDFELGWRRHVMALTLAAVVFVIGQWEQVRSPGPQDGDLLGPAIANAIDGETLFVGGTEVKLFGIDAVESDQICQDADGADYPCGRRATQALQAIVQQDLVVCLPLFAIGDTRVVGNCEVTSQGRFEPVSPIAFMEQVRPNNLSRLMVVQGHALAIGVGTRFFGAQQNEAQALRRGIWQGSFQPPSNWRRRSRNP